MEKIAAARTIAKSLGGYVKDPRFEWEARGFRACDGCDPEGNVFQIRELIAEHRDAIYGSLEAVDRLTVLVFSHYQH